jgi:hypothetical protein
MTQEELIKTISLGEGAGEWNLEEISRNLVKSV